MSNCKKDKERLIDFCSHVLQERAKKVLFNENNKLDKDKLLIEQYKCYVNVMDQVGRRRDTHNNYLVAINAALIAAIAFKFDIYWGLIFPSVGVLICAYWVRLSRNFAKLTEVKFSLIQEIESRLPLSLFKAEWLALGKGKFCAHYKRLPKIEKLLPWCFIVLYFIYIVILVLDLANVISIKGISLFNKN
ncbi:MAG TPA: hypothetical protein VM054_01680 [bacterium]|nr:hypothetical protein [bacterium]